MLAKQRVTVDESCFRWQIFVSVLRYVALNCPPC